MRVESAKRDSIYGVVLRGEQRIIEETPHIKYRTSIVVWILLGLLLLLIGAGLLAALFAARR